MSLINIRNLSFEYDGSFEKVFENVNLQLDTLKLSIKVDTIIANKNQAARIEVS